ncbi:unnamed protein product (macronuclear) [Paramecium tetraurelia]|uniref:Uncharacterized protein n=1 Tax=Paramecium tetraurelia TaxID=5888 RepID=A0BYW0_PARTE|nr:uncharacterized protein GSPATT00033580001 [Paramecium tetraurelia]CAK63727.1 unnamed protein product [Paramecium tetraurelia]|eukprot:XP_001431125.1 hypothetical protein (macronuclear) [Paramecium tetraurelia strain d4-2]
MSDSQKIVGIVFSKLESKRSHPTYIVETKAGNLIYRQAANLPSEQIEKFNLIFSKQIADKLYPSQDKRLFYKGTELDLPDVQFDDDSDDGSKSTKQQCNCQSKQTTKFTKQTPNVQSYQPLQLPSKSTIKLSSTTILTYEKIDGEFKQASRIDCNLIKDIKNWEQAKISKKKQVMLCISNDSYVKLADLRFKNPSLVLDYVLNNCILVK